MFTEEERRNLKKTLTDGLTLLPGTDVSALTMQIWENIASLPHPIDSNFNIMGSSAILKVLNESKESILHININKDKLDFELGIPEYKFTHSDKTTAAFATMCTVQAWYKLTNFV